MQLNKVDLVKIVNIKKKCLRLKDNFLLSSQKWLIFITFSHIFKYVNSKKEITIAKNNVDFNHKLCLLAAGI